MKGLGDRAKVVRVFSDVLVAFLYFDICHYHGVASTPELATR